MSVETITLGRRLNFAESETMSQLASGKATIINSCVVTAEAQRQTRKAIRRERPQARIVVTSYAAQLSTVAYRAIADVDADELRDFSVAPKIASGFRGRVRIFVAVETG